MLAVSNPLTRSALAAGATCAVAEPPPLGSGYDDCGRGLLCTGSECLHICNRSDPSTCPADFECIQNAGQFSSESGTGVCVPTCDPLTQFRTAGGASCGAGRGCYASFGTTRTAFVCATAGTTAIGADITGTPFINACVPGGIPALRMMGGSTAYCTSFCRPVETSSAAPAGAGGAAPYTCAAGGLGPPYECQFAWTRAVPDDFDPRLNELGVCFDRTGFTWDVDMDGTPDPWPSCTTVAPTDTNADGIADHRFFGCAPALEP